jgi:hypothetical protein
MDNKINWSHLLQSADKESGLIMKAYSLFHHYSYSNQIAAIVHVHSTVLSPAR